ncbi:MAG: dibenzothiophene desulfurase [Boseongicola sp. SB0673_bin_14]|nr:dibenzothiophene desulfurase [Boseongicola sp. SB0667_bin_21]MYI69680.1 dibenzothiophene desulfurase [Boseongicola sp. SB0673_bin_14]
MHPAPSIILFTTLSGLGFGMLAFLGIDASPPTGWSALAFLGIAFALAGGGLLASTFHLGHPERALKAFTQWRSSWLSREAWVSLLALTAMAAHGAGLVFLEQAWRPLGIVGAVLSLATVYATSMIYLQMRTVPRWNHWSPPVLFLGFALAGGALTTGRVSVALWALPLLAVVQAFAWIDQERRERSTGTDLATATGLGHAGRVRAFEAPHTGESYLTREMVFQVGRKHAMVLKVISALLFAVVPVVLLLLPFTHFLVVPAVASHLLGALIQRWLFFAEARHVVGQYYGRWDMTGMRGG